MNQKAMADLRKVARLQPLRATALATLELSLQWADKSLE